jgi:hypothetical protein
MNQSTVRFLSLGPLTLVMMRRVARGLCVVCNSCFKVFADTGSTKIEDDVLGADDVANVDESSKAQDDST